MVFLFVGEDEFAKDEKLAIIKRDVLGKETENFNFDILYSREIDLVRLQEVLARLPLKAKRRIIVIKDAQRLKDKLREFLISYAKRPFRHLILILDVRRYERNDAFLSKISKYTKIFRFKESQLTNTFSLAEQIDRRKIATSLSLLYRLLSQGEKPERIMGGLRYFWERGHGQYLKKNRRLDLLLNCDLDIKTGRVNPVFALERLLVNLCCL